MILQCFLYAKYIKLSYDKYGKFGTPSTKIYFYYN